MSWLRTRRAPSTGASYNTGASSQRSRPVPRPVVLDVLALLSRCCRTSRGCSCLLAGGYSIRSLRISVLYYNSRLTSPGPCPDHEVLALVRPVVPYTLTLSSKRSRPVVSPAPCRSVATPNRRVAVRLSKALLSFTNLK